MNNLETEIEMKEDLENDLIEYEDACDDVKNDSSRVYLTQPSNDLMTACERGGDVRRLA